MIRCVLLEMHIYRVIEFLFINVKQKDVCATLEDLIHMKMLVKCPLHV